MVHIGVCGVALTWVWFLCLGYNLKGEWLHKALPLLRMETPMQITRLLGKHLFPEFELKLYWAQGSALFLEDYVFMKWKILSHAGG